jgi:hypothetical protein
MTPDGAASILKEMTTDQMVKILVFMKESETGPLLEMLAKTGPDEARRVAEITERLRLFASQNKGGKSKTP